VLTIDKVAQRASEPDRSKAWRVGRLHISDLAFLCSLAQFVGQASLAPCGGSLRSEVREVGGALPVAARTSLFGGSLVRWRSSRSGCEAPRHIRQARRLGSWR
jgi:hypothetical protein